LARQSGRTISAAVLDALRQSRPRADAPERGAIGSSGGAGC